VGPNIILTGKDKRKKGEKYSGGVKNSGGGEESLLHPGTLKKSSFEKTLRPRTEKNQARTGAKNKGF